MSLCAYKLYSETCQKHFSHVQNSILFKKCEPYTDRGPCSNCVIAPRDSGIPLVSILQGRQVQFSSIQLFPNLIKYEKWYILSSVERGKNAIQVLSRVAHDLLSGQLGYFTFLFLLELLYKTVQNRNLELYVLGNLGKKSVGLFSVKKKSFFFEYDGCEIKWTCARKIVHLDIPYCYDSKQI